MSANHEKERICATCLRVIPADAPLGLCPACLFDVAVQSVPDPAYEATLLAGAALPSAPPPASQGELFGNYELLGRLGKGGMGEVYRARHLWAGHVVALKKLPEGEEANEAAMRLFRREMEAFGKIDHPGIVEMYEAGEHGGRLYFTMKLMRGGSLRDRIERGPMSNDEAAALVRTVAEAVHHLHQRGVLHRDLKPDNILLDEAGAPRVADFGVAFHAGTGARLDDARTRAGTMPYMSAEALEGGTTARSDVYALGVILFELLTGRRPFVAESAAELMAMIRRGGAPDPRVYAPDVDADLARICLRCLEKEPERRYRSAEDLTFQLGRYLRGEPPEGPSRWRRALHACRQHPITTGLIAAAVAFLLVMAAGGLSVAHDERVARQAQVRESNRIIAGLVAGSVLSYLRGLGDAVLLIAQDEALGQAVVDDRVEDLRAVCRAAHERNRMREGAPSFDLWFILDREGKTLAQHGVTDFRGEYYNVRDYYRGAKRLGESKARRAYVSSAFRSHTDGSARFAVSAPIYDRTGEFRGVLVAGVSTRAHLGSLVLDDERSTAVLAAPRDAWDLGDEPTAPLREALILRHPAYTKAGEWRVLRDPQILDVGRSVLADPRHVEVWQDGPEASPGITIEDYEDPLGAGNPRFAGRRPAAFAPVGRTGFAVIVQSNERDPLLPMKALLAKLARWFGTAAAPSAALLLLAFWIARARGRRARRAAG